MKNIAIAIVLLMGKELVAADLDPAYQNPNYLVVPPASPILVTSAFHPFKKTVYNTTLAMEFTPIDSEGGGDIKYALKVTPIMTTPVRKWKWAWLECFCRCCCCGRNAND